jgi:hypothetical protein
MKELEIVKDTFIGEVPFESRSITFRVLGTRKEYTINYIKHGDYMYFRKKFFAKDAKGWSGFNFLKDIYGVEDDKDTTPEEKKETERLFSEFWKKIPKPT